jgi:dTDP-glucose 4,6-dehydratase
MAKKKTLLVTGGAGFIGSHFIRYTLKKYPQYRILNLDALTYAGNLENLKDVERFARGRYRFVRGNICDRKLLKSLFQKNKFDMAVHFAAESHVDNSILHAHKFIDTNIDGTFSLINAAHTFNTRRFVHISSDEVYGDLKRGSSQESSKFNPSSPYSASKAAADLLVQAYVRTHKFSAVTLRASNNFGTHQYPEKLIPSAVTNVLEGKPILVHGDGGQIRTWLHVLDFCRAIDLVMHKAKDGSVYNVGGVPLTVMSITRMIVKCLGVKEDRFIEKVVDRPGQDRRYRPSDARIRRELGWRPRYSIQKDLAPVVRWYSQNPGWWKKLKNTKNFKYNEKKWQGIRYAFKKGGA